MRRHSGGTACGTASFDKRLRRTDNRMVHSDRRPCYGQISPSSDLRGDNTFRRNTMKNTALKVLLTAAVLISVAVYAQPRPGNPTTATVITKAEIDKIGATEQNQTTRDENAKVVDIGDGWSMELGIIHRAKQRVLTVGEAKARAAGG